MAIYIFARIGGAHRVKPATAQKDRCALACLGSPGVEWLALGRFVAVIQRYQGAWMRISGVGPQADRLSDFLRQAPSIMNANCFRSMSGSALWTAVWLPTRRF